MNSLSQQMINVRVKDADMLNFEKHLFEDILDQYLKFNRGPRFVAVVKKWPNNDKNCLVTPEQKLNT